MAVKKDPRELETAEPFKSLFPVGREELQLVKDSMAEHGYDANKPVLLWKDAFGDRGRQVVVDGHTRLQAALDLKLPEVWATVRQYKGVDAAITAGIGEQVIRRNLNREQIAAYVIGILPLLDETDGGLRTRTATELAKLLGVSKPTVDRARSLLSSGRDDLVDKVKDGKLSLLAAWQESLNGNAAEDEWRGSNIMTAAEVIAQETPPPFVPEPEPPGFDEAFAEAQADRAAGAEPIPGQITVDEALDEPVSPLDGWLTDLEWTLGYLDEHLGNLRSWVVGATVQIEDADPVTVTEIWVSANGDVFAGDEKTWFKLADVLGAAESVELPAGYTP